MRLIVTHEDVLQAVSEWLERRDVKGPPERLVVNYLVEGTCRDDQETVGVEFHIPEFGLAEAQEALGRGTRRRRRAGPGGAGEGS